MPPRAVLLGGGSIPGRRLERRRRRRKKRDGIRTTDYIRRVVCVTIGPARVGCDTIGPADMCDGQASPILGVDCRRITAHQPPFRSVCHGNCACHPFSGQYTEEFVQAPTCFAVCTPWNWCAKLTLCTNSMERRVDLSLEREGGSATNSLSQTIFSRACSEPKFLPQSTSLRHECVSPTSPSRHSTSSTI